MMTPRQYMALLCFFVVYMFFGACVFYYFEHNKELEERANLLELRIKVNELLVRFASPEDKAIQNTVLNRVSKYCGRPVTNYTLDKYPADYKRTWFHSFWFTFIVCSSLGYGSSSPHDLRAQAFLIFYALFGLPLTGFILAYLAEFFSKSFIGLYKRYKGQEYSKTLNYDVSKKFGLVARITMLLIPGMAIFIFLPACLFTYFEEWPYVTSVYYAFITLTTIGFGDYVPTFQNGQARKFGFYFTLYQTFIILWSFLGAGYFIMIIGFIAKGMQSKRIARLEHQLSMNIKMTQNKIWSGVTSDLSFLRRILNEVNLMKFQPVYTDSAEGIAFNSLSRSLSCPELTMYRGEPPSGIFRKRTNSENYGQSQSSTRNSAMALNRVQSEGDLSRIDKEKTFKAFEGSKTQDVLSNILSALTNIQQVHDDELSSSQMWTSDRTESQQSNFSDDDTYFNRPKRPRAFSDFHLGQQETFDNSNELTWNCNSDHRIQEYLRNRPKKFSLASIFASNSEAPQSEISRQTTLQVPGDGRRKSFISKMNPFKAGEGKRHSVSTLDPQTYLNKSAKGRASVFGTSQSATEDMELLEKTTIADLMRAVEEIQSNVTPQTPLLTDCRHSLRRRTSTVLSNLQVAPIGSRRGSLRPVPAYTTVFSSKNLSQQNDSLNNIPESTSSLSTVKATTPNLTRRNVSTMAPHKSPTLQTSQNTFSLTPSPLTTPSSHTTPNTRPISETPIITIQSPDVTERNVLWPPESRIADRSVSELKNRSKHKRADSK